MHLFFEFHCASTDNEAGVASGHHDPDLSAIGERAAEAMGDRYKRRDIVKVYSSDLLRARRTAEIAFGGRGVPIVHDARLRECNYGELNGSNAKDMRANRGQYVANPYPRGESWAGAAMRTIRMLNEVRKLHEGTQKVVFVGHSATYYALESYVSGTKIAALVAEPWPWKPVWEWEANLA